MSFDSMADIKRIVLFRADEPTDGTSDFDTALDDILIEIWRDLVTRHPWLALTKDAPGTFLTVAADATTYTITIAAAGQNAAMTLAPAPAVGLGSFAGRKIAVANTDWIARILTHVAGAAAGTVDAAPVAVAAGTAVTIFQDEYDLNADLGCFVDGLWAPGINDPVELWSEERMRVEYRHKTAAGFPPRAFCRLTDTRIRLSHYPDRVARIEYPYSYEPDPPASNDATALVIDKPLRPALATGALGLLYKLKLDRRFQLTAQSYENRLQRAIERDTRLKIAVAGRRSQAARRSIWGE